MCFRARHGEVSTHIFLAPVLQAPPERRDKEPKACLSKYQGVNNLVRAVPPASFGNPQWLLSMSGAP